MRFSLWPVSSTSWEDTLEVARIADGSGWDGVYVADHFMGDAAGFGPGPRPPSRPRRARRARRARPTRVRLGSLVLRRHLPAPGGAGQLGRDRRPRQRRAAACWASAPAGRRTSTSSTASSSAPRASGSTGSTRSCQVVRGLLRRADHDGRRRALPRDRRASASPSRCRIRCRSSSAARATGCSARRPPRRRVEHVVVPSTFAERSAALDAACEREGRDPAAIHRSTADGGVPRGRRREGCRARGAGVAAPCGGRRPGIARRAVRRLRRGRRRRDHRPHPNARQGRSGGRTSWPRSLEACGAGTGEQSYTPDCAPE